LHLLLVLLLEQIHLLGLFMGAVDRLANGHANGTARVLTAVVMGEDVSGGYAVRDLALLVLALSNMLPKALHSGAVTSHGALPVLVGALGRVAEEEKALLLVPKDLLPVGVIGGGCAASGSSNSLFPVGGGLLSGLEGTGGH
jgi:hypothetical protein